MSTPTFSLPACPACSTRGGLHRPIWRHAHNTSVKRGVDCYFFSGCKHAAEVAPPGRIHDKQEELEAVEAAWSERVQRLFEAQTAHWTEAQRTSWKTFIADKTEAKT